MFDVTHVITVQDGIIGLVFYVIGGLVLYYLTEKGVL